MKKWRHNGPQRPQPTHTQGVSNRSAGLTSVDFQKCLGDILMKIQ